MRPFDKDSFASYLCVKTFRKNKEYRYAVFEAIRIVNFDNEIITDDMLQGLIPGNEVSMQFIQHHFVY